MFIYNINLNKTNIAKCAFTIAAILLIFIFCFATYRIIKEGKNSACEQNNDVIEIDSSNYTNILKETHDNLEKYVGKKIKLSGYIYKLPDFDENQFVLARDMIISSNLKTLVVGFLCSSNDINNFEANTWVEITGTITKGNYHEVIPVINVIQIKQITKPSEIYVYPPDDSFVPTVNLY